MKKTAMVFLICLLCSTLMAQQDMVRVLSQVEQAMESGSYRKMLRLVDGTYAQEQLYGMLQGNVQQFIDELVSGNTRPNQTGEYLSVHLTDIAKVSLWSVADTGSGKEVIFQLQLKDGRSVYPEILFKWDQVAGKWGMTGAVG